MYINEKGKFINDGIYITYYSHLRCDTYKIKVIINGEVVKQGRESLNPEDSKDEILNFKSEFNLPVYDARGIFWNTFSDRWCLSPKSDALFPDLIDELITFTEEDRDNIDQRPVLTCNWAVHIGGGRFKIYKKMSKSRFDLYDPQMFRGLASITYKVSERISETVDFINDSSESYIGDIDEVISNEFVVIINNSIRTNDHEFVNLINFVKKNDFGLIEYPIKLKFSYLSEDDVRYLDIEDMQEANWFSDFEVYNDALQDVFDAYCAVNKESQITERFPIGNQYILAVKNNKCRLLTKSELDFIEALKCGDVLAHYKFGNIIDYRVVLEVNGWDVRYSDVQKCVSEDDFWYIPRYSIDKDLYNSALDGKLKSCWMELPKESWQLYKSASEVI